jgi:MFS family permease
MHGLSQPAAVVGARAQELRRGWPLLLAAALGMIPLQMPMHTAGVFIPIWQAEFNWSRSEIATAMSIYTVTLVLLSPFVGAVIDRFGARIPTTISLALLVPAFVAFSFVGNSIWSLYLVYAAFAVLGVGTTTVPFCRAIVQQFDQVRGIALAIAQSATAISIMIAPVLAYGLLQLFSWRQSWTYLAFLPAILVPLVFFGLKDRRPASPAFGEPVTVVALTGIAFRDALRMPRLWLFAISFGMFFFATVGLIGQLVPLLGSMGISTGDAVAYQSVMAVAVLVGRLGTGHLLDRVFASHVYLAVALIGAAGFLILTFGLIDLVGVAIVCAGLALGAEIDVASYMVSKYFGVKSYGKLFGIIYASLIAGGIVAHPFFGYVYDQYGDYKYATLVSAILMVLGGLLLFRMAPYPKFEN